jgi:uncharacterized protein YkwD
MPRRSRPTTHRDHAERGGPSAPPRLVVALGTWAGVVAAAGVLALQLSAAPSDDGAERESVAATAAAAPVTILLASNPTTTASAPTTTVAPTTSTPPPPVEAPPATEPPVEPAPRNAPAVEATPPPVVEAPPATEPPPPPPAPTPAPSADVDTAAEAMLLDDHNRHRAEAGLPPLVRNGCLDQVARDWARQMASSGTMRHNPDLGAAIDRCIAYTAAGENVGYGPDVAVLAARFWESPGHRANIVGSYQYVGIGIVVGADGTRWAAVEFAAG